MSETAANNKNITPPFSISSGTAWASMSAILDKEMPVLPIEEEKRKKRRIFIIFPILTAAVVVSFFVITTYQGVPDHPQNNGNPFSKPAGEMVRYNTGKNISHMDIISNSAAVSNLSSTVNNNSANNNAGDNRHNTAKKYSSAILIKTQLSGLTNTNTNKYTINAASAAAVIEKTDRPDSIIYAVLQQSKKPNFPITAPFNKNIIVTGSADKIMEDTTIQPGRPDQKNQLEWMAGAGIERGIKNEDLVYYLTSKIMLPLSGKFSLGTGLVLLNGNGNIASENVYTRSFATNPTVVKNVNKITTFRNFTYISVPVQLVYKINPSLYIGAGIQNSFLLKYKETENVELYDVNMSFLATYPTTAVDVGTISIRQIDPATRVTKYDPRMLGTVGYTYKSFRLEINYEHGIKNAIKPADHYSSYSTGKTQTLGASLFYNIK